MIGMAQEETQWQRDKYLFESEVIAETLRANLSLEALGNSQRLDYRPHSVQP